MSLTSLTSFVDTSNNNRISVCHSASNIHIQTKNKKNLTLSTSPSYLLTATNLQKTIDTNQSINFNQTYQPTFDNLDKELSKLERKRSFAKLNVIDSNSRALTTNKTESNIFNRQRSNYYQNTQFMTLSEHIGKSKEHTIKKELEFLKESLLNDTNSKKLLINPPVAYAQTTTNKMNVFNFRNNNSNITMKFIKYCSPVQRKIINTDTKSKLMNMKSNKKKTTFLPLKYPSNFREKSELELFMQDFKSNNTINTSKTGLLSFNKQSKY